MAMEKVLRTEELRKRSEEILKKITDNLLVFSEAENDLCECNNDLSMA